MEMVFKGGEMLGCDIAIIKSVNGILPNTSGFHAACKLDPGNFAFPDNHDYWKLSGKIAGVTTGTGAS